MEKESAKEKVTLRMVAEHAGISVSAVSMILNHYKNASFPDETKKRVYDACEALGYQKQPSEAKSAQNTKLIVIIVPSFENPYYTGVLTACIKRAEERGYCAMTLCTQRKADEEANLIHICRAVNASGVLCLYQPQYGTILHQLHEEFPLIQLYDTSADPMLSVISIDGFRIGSLIAEHLYHLNHRKIAYLGRTFSKRQSGTGRRLAGMRDYFTRKGLNPLDCVQCYSIETEKINVSKIPDSFETGRLLTEHLLRKKIPFTALVGTSDVIAYGIIDALLSHNKRIPQDYSVCGCDNLPFSQTQSISLTTVEHFGSEKGHDAIDLLIREIENRTGENGKRRSVNKTRMEYEPRLIVRNSTGKCRSLPSEAKKLHTVQ